jgi:hypothetical protein
MIVVKDTMSTAMQSTTAGLEAVVGVLTDIKEIMEKIV